MQKESWKSWLYRLVFNFWPCISGTGAKVTYIAADFHELRVKIPLSWRTRNRVGTIFGGSMYAATDPFYMLMFMEILGHDFVVWDKAASIHFRRPGKTTLYVTFHVTKEEAESIRTEVLAKGELSRDFPLNLVDKDGVVHAEVLKTVYMATKKFYKEKMAARAQHKA